MENFNELLLRRHSTRRFTDEAIAPDDIKLILEAGLLAPSGKSRNPWQFIVVEDKEMLEQLSVAKEHGAKLIRNAAIAIVVVCDSVLSDTWIEDGSIASTLMQLQCEELGLGSCWVQIRERLSASGQQAEDVVRQLLNIPYSLSVLNIIAIGHKNEQKEPTNPQSEEWEKVHIDKWA